MGSNVFMVDYSRMDNLDQEITQLISRIKLDSAEVEMEVNRLIGTTQMSGNTADNIKHYLRDTHKTALAGMRDNALLLYASWKEYRTRYFDTVDSCGNTIIDIRELCDIPMRLKTPVDETEAISREVSRIVSSVGDISEIASMGIDASFAVIGDFYYSLSTFLKSLEQKIMSIEDEFSACFDNGKSATALDGIQSLQKLVQVSYSEKSDFKSDYDVNKSNHAQIMKEAEESSRNTQVALEDVSKIIGGLLEADQAHYTRARTEADIANLREVEARREEVRFKKGIVLAATLVVDIVVVVGTAGMGTPAVIGVNALAGGLTTGLSKATDSAVDQYITGGEINYGDVWKEGGKGFFVGGTTSAISSGINEYTKGIKQADEISKVLKPATNTVGSRIKKELLSLGINEASSISTSMLTGITERAIERAVDDIRDGKGMSDSIVDSLRNAFDLKEMSKDTSTGVLDGLIDDLFDSLKTQKGFDKLGDKGKGTSGVAIIQDTIVGSMKSAVSKIANDTVSYVTEDSHEKGYGDTVFGPENWPEIVTKMLRSAGKEMAKTGNVEVRLREGYELQDKIYEKEHMKEWYEKKQDRFASDPLQASVNRTEVELDQLNEKFDKNFERDSEGKIKIKKDSHRRDRQEDKGGSAMLDVSDASADNRAYEYYIGELDNISATLGLPTW